METAQMKSQPSGIALDGTVAHECAPVASGDLSRSDLPPGASGAPDGQHLGCLLGVTRNGEQEVTSILCPTGELEAACRDLEGGAVVQIDASPVPPAGRFWLPTSVVRVRGPAERSGAVRRRTPAYKAEPERAFFVGGKPS